MLVGFCPVFDSFFQFLTFPAHQPPIVLFEADGQMKVKLFVDGFVELCSFIAGYCIADFVLGYHFNQIL